MSEFVRKGNKYFRNNSDGTLTQVTPTKNGYFTWVLPDGKKVRSLKRYKIISTSPNANGTSLWDSFKTGLRNFGAYSATSEPSGSAIQTSEGTLINNDGSFTYNKPTLGSELLRKINGAIGLAGLAGYGGAAALSYTPSIVPEITIGLLPWGQTAIGTAAGSMATGMAADEISKATTSKSIGGHARSGIASLGPAGLMYADIIPEGVWNLANPFYTINPSNIIPDISLIRNWRPFLPYNSDRFYRIVGAQDNAMGDAILDANVTGVIRSKATGKGINFTTPDGEVHSIGKTGFNYPMFSKGRVWRGSTNGAGRNYRVIRSKADTGPIKWEQSNVDFRHKGHSGIYRPSYYGHLNIAPAEYFEYWEPARFFGWNKKEFTPFLLNRNLGKLEYDPNEFVSFVKGLGRELGEGEESIALLGQNNTVYKIMHNPEAQAGPQLEASPSEVKNLFDNYITPRNQLPMFEPITYEGYVVDKRGIKLPVVSLRKLNDVPKGGLSETEGLAILDNVENVMIENGFTPKRSALGWPYYQKGETFVHDMHPWNVGKDNNGNLKVFDLLLGKPFY